MGDKNLALRVTSLPSGDIEGISLPSGDIEGIRVGDFVDIEVIPPINRRQEEELRRLAVGKLGIYRVLDTLLNYVGVRPTSQTPGTDKSGGNDTPLYHV